MPVEPGSTVNRINRSNSGSNGSTGWPIDPLAWPVRSPGRFSQHWPQGDYEEGNVDAMNFKSPNETMIANDNVQQLTRDVYLVTIIWASMFQNQLSTFYKNPLRCLDLENWKKRKKYLKKELSLRYLVWGKSKRKKKQRGKK